MAEAINQYKFSESYSNDAERRLQEGHRRNSGWFAAKTQTMTKDGLFKDFQVVVSLLIFLILYWAITICMAKITYNT